ncbi:MAG: TIGR04423 family type III CRISPR-associated protein [Rickettsiales bacterium]|jgi:CRISPR type III-associated protein (TIGR04423 family)|nr:TIGR04423 family type III CRISPR-associated protein [Rickettsiales bacterium]
MKIIDIKEPCEGYVWRSDEEKPEVFYNEPINLSLDEEKNPFVIEGQLYVKDKMSYSIKYVDGKYYVTEYNIENISSDYELKEYIPNRIAKKDITIDKIYFRQYWKPEEDVLCEKMSVLVPSAYVFVGFKLKED